MSFLQSSLAQLIENGDTLYGNEWINYDQTTLKIKVAEDGLYRLTYDVLLAAGIPIEQIPASAYRLYWMGKEQKIHSSTTNPLSPGDYLEFYGRRNRSGLDRYLFQDPDQEMLNPEYSFHTDTSSYFLTWDGQAGVRYEEIVNDLNGALPPLRSWYQHTETLVLADGHFKPFLNSQVRFSHYVEAEGFGSSESTSHDFSLPASAALPAQSTSTIHYRLTGNSQFHEVSISWNGQPLSSHTFPGANGRGGAPLIDTVIPVSGLQETNTLSAQSGGGNDKIRFGTIALTYPRELRFDGQPAFGLTLDDIRDGATLEFLGLNTSTRYRVFDLSAGYLTEIIFEGDVGRLNLPPGPNRRELHVVSDVGVKTVSVAKKTQWERLDRSDAEFIIISNPKLYDDGQGTNWVQEYANYRQSNPGGSYRTKIIDIDQVIDQFAYGVDMHPLGIKNFSNYLAKYWTDPQFIFLVGKGLEYAEARRHEEPYEYLPVYGLPGSDNLLTSRALSSVPLVPVGRIAARSPDQIGIYLDKIKVMEDQIANAPQTIEARGWMKRVLHLSAGNRGSEQDVIFSKMEQMAGEIEGNGFGAEVLTFRNKAQDIISEAQSDEILQIINDGIIMKTYFGHGGINQTQFDGFEDPRFLNNRDRYPTMIALGCHTGNIFTTTESLGETNLFAPNKGAALYLATSGLGFLNALDEYAKILYGYLGGQYFTRGMGLSIKNTNLRFDKNPSISIRTLLQQFTMHGDPSYSLSAHDKPDILVSTRSIRTNPEILTVDVDSFDLFFDVVNLGKNVDDTIVIKIDHTLPSSHANVFLYNTPIDGFLTPQLKKVALVSDMLVGKNSIVINIDADDSIDESPKPDAEENNQTDPFEFFVFNSGITPTYPSEFALINCDPLQLAAFAGENSGSENRYILEIDDNASFKSSSLIRHVETSIGGLVSWIDESAILEKEKVYFWRVTTDSILARNLPWTTSSFRNTAKGKYGWHQSHPYQIRKNSFNQLSIDSATGSLQFIPFFINLKIFNGKPVEGFAPLILVNGNLPPQNLYFTPSGDINVAVIDGNELVTRPLRGANRNRSFKLTTTGQRKAFMDFLEDGVIEGDYILIYTQLHENQVDLDPSSWLDDSLELDGRNIFNYLEAQGSTMVRDFIGHFHLPYTFCYKKGGAVIAEVIGSDLDDQIEFIASPFSFLTKGSITSSLIGPAKVWKSLSVGLHLADTSDQVFIEIRGSGSDGENHLLDRFSMQGPSLEMPLANIDPGQYPYLQLTLDLEDEAEKTAPQLEFWEIEFDAYGDLLFNVNTEDFEVDSSGLDGEVVFRIPIVNMSKFGMDSTLVRYKIQDASSTSTGQDVRIGSFDPFDERIFEVSFNKSDFTGNVTMTLELNPDGDQPEANRTNNFYSHRFSFSVDKIPPLIDVFFDGRRIMANDIVSPSSVIDIVLRDENILVPIETADDIKLLIRRPESASFDPVNHMDNSDFEFLPAKSGSENKATLRWYATFEENGIYSLKVNGSDAANNKSSNIDYEITFEVILENSISRFLPYPNPFTSSTKFAYTLTGQPPSQFIVQILTVEGTVVKEITQAEFGALRVGSNLSEYSWNGTDDFGDNLANGIYLYRVIAKDETGQDYRLFNRNDVSEFFAKGYGKIAILR